MLSKRSDILGAQDKTPDSLGVVANNTNLDLPQLRKKFFAIADEALQLASDLKGHIGQKKIAIIESDTEVDEIEDGIEELISIIQNRQDELISIENELRTLSDTAIDRTIQSKINEVRNTITPLIENY